ncbi:hypothetical protein JW905_07830, partial [bacterium]|nr:hypothetical protein [candidate division CSSED10-310 bacterium]
VAEDLKEARRPLVVIAASSLHEAFDTARLQAALAMAARLKPLPGGGSPILCLMNSGNVQGAMDAGVHPDFLPGYEPVSDDMHGKNLESLFAAIEEEQIKAVLLLGEGLADTMEQCGFDPACLQRCEMFIVLSSHRSRDTDLAHTHVRIAGWGECGGTKTTVYRHILRARAAVSGHAPARRVLGAAAAALGAGALGAGALGAAALGAGALGAAALGAAALGAGALGAAIEPKPPMYDRGTEDADSRTIWPWHPRSAAELPLPRLQGYPQEHSADYPLLLTITRRLGDGQPLSEHSMNIVPLRRDGMLQMSFQDARHLGIEEGAEVIVESERGAVTLRVALDNELPVGTVSMAMGAPWRRLLATFNLAAWRREGRLPPVYVRISIP